MLLDFMEEFISVIGNQANQLALVLVAKDLSHECYVEEFTLCIGAIFVLRSEQVFPLLTFFKFFFHLLFDLFQGKVFLRSNRFGFKF